MLRPADLGEETKTLKILSIGPADAEFSQYSNMQVEVEMDGLKYVLPMDTSKQNYLLLHERFGGESANWIGKTFRVRSNYSRQYETDFVAVQRERAAGGKK